MTHHSTAALPGNPDMSQYYTEEHRSSLKEVGLEVNSEKTKYMSMSRKKAGQKPSPALSAVLTVGLK
jgi:hypothetical protein